MLSKGRSRAESKGTENPPPETVLPESPSAGALENSPVCYAGHPAATESFIRVAARGGGRRAHDRSCGLS
jgi:hypothetical protein